MNVNIPCMHWVPVCWRELLGVLRINSKLVDDNTLLDSVVADKPISDSTAFDSLNNPTSNLSAAEHPLPGVDGTLGNPLILDDPFDTIVIPTNKPPSKLHADILPDLPNSIIENILSRLPPKCIFHWQRDSRALQVLTETRYFTRMQLNRTSPVIILQSIPKSACDGNMELYFIDAESHNVDRKIVEIDSYYMQKHNPIHLIGSHDGFLLFTNRYKNPPAFYLWNPITNQKADFCPTHSEFQVCGFYFCTIRMDYVLLFVSKDGPPFEFKMYNLGTESWEKAGNFSYPPSCYRPPAIVNKILYWMVDQSTLREETGDYPHHSHSVVSFESETKKFGTIGHDKFSGMSVLDRYYLQVHLLEIEEELCICDFITSTKLELSVLNQGTKCWVKRHILILPTGDFSFLKRPLGSFGCWANKLSMEVLYYKKGELLVRQKERLYIYSLHSNTCRLVESKGLVENRYFQSIVHTDSLVWF